MEGRGCGPIRGSHPSICLKGQRKTAANIRLVSALAKIGAGYFQNTRRLLNKNIYIAFINLE